MTRRMPTLLCIVACLALAAPAPISCQDGRWKDDGNGGCYFDASDSGPNQCQPPADTAR